MKFEVKIYGPVGGPYKYELRTVHEEATGIDRYSSPDISVNDFESLESMKKALASAFDCVVAELEKL